MSPHQHFKMWSGDTYEVRTFSWVPGTDYDFDTMIVDMLRVTGADFAEAVGQPCFCGNKLGCKTPKPPVTQYEEGV